MANGTYFDALGLYGEAADIISGPLTVVRATATRLTLVDAEGDGFTLKGTGLEYGLEGAVAGRFTGVTLFNAGGAPLVEVTDFSVTAAQLSSAINAGGVDAAAPLVFKGGDRIIGSNLGDLISGYAGNDTIRAGGGKDLVAGARGDDTLYGQGAKDTFVYRDGDGNDRIMDFTDTGGRADDVIALRQDMYDAMTVVETANGVMLQFSLGREGSIECLSWTLEQVGEDDFVII